ncbi:tyrosine-type recombinase/integrase [Nocardia huaxiensis]|uniref:tyrosine-type recombinase/integrase n=1 Tax=Nocardia huaxiensis TaxID=2755382 RepID=UPI001E29B784|nr:tyrosine-type recombinase/integrase [Nocardia huaxiensis]UFS99089.1 tyrosine-type recombinase/integrase [Nocardia huaxiensis]
MVNGKVQIPLGVTVTGDIEERGKVSSFRARVRWKDPVTKKRASKSESFGTREEAEEWIEKIKQAAERGVDPKTATATLKEYGSTNWDIAMRGIEPKTLDPYRAGWRVRIVPTLGHLQVTMITAGVADRAVTQWISEGCSRSTVKNTLAALGRVIDQAVRDELIDRNRVEVNGWQKQYKRYEDELENPRELALPNWEALTTLADALVDSSSDHYYGWGDVVTFMACTATRIGEVSGCRVRDIDTDKWIWNLRRQTTPGPGGMQDKGTKGKRSRSIPIIEEVRPLVQRTIARAHARIESDPALRNSDETTRREALRNARLFIGPRGGRIETGVLRRATDWDRVVTELGYEHLRRHDLRHTGLTWLADAGVLPHRLQRIAGHSDPAITQRYLHPDIEAIQNDGDKLSLHLRGRDGPKLVPRLRIVK